MTIQLPSESLTDKLLLFLGKRRAIYLPQAKGKDNLQTHMKALKEPFFRVLFRRKNSPLPNGWCYLDSFLSKEKSNAD